MIASPARLIAGGVCVWIAAGVWSAATGRPAIASLTSAVAAQSQTSLQREPPSAPGTPHAAPNARHPAPDPSYVGSAACERCHEEQYATWRKALHLQMTKPIAEARVIGDFRPGTHLEAHGRAYKMEARDGQYFITVTWGSDPPQTYRVDYTLGARRFQGYLSKLPDGRIYVLPVFWHDETKRWLDWKETTPVPDDTAHVRQIWNVECVNCHATNLAKNYDSGSNTYDTSWTEMGIGCEACHGPGAAHIKKMDEWAKNPRRAPAYDGSDSNRQLGPLLATFSPRTADPRQVFDTCGYCHGNKTNKFFGFHPGDRFEDFALPFLISEPLPRNDPQGDFWTDGRPSRFNRPQALTLSGCFMRGEITCTRCHTIHGASHDHALKIAVEAAGKTTRASDALCTQCHGTNAETAGNAKAAEKAENAERRGMAGEAVETGEAGTAGETGSAKASAERAESENPMSELPHATAYGAAAVPPTPIPDLQAHTHHPPDSPGSRCIECHMSDVNWRLFTRRRDHSLQPPVPEMTARFGVANACNTCHDDKSPEWAASVMDRWYGNGAKRRAVVDMADVFYRAGSGDASALPQVARYAVDRTRGALIRASACEFAGQLLSKASGPTDAAVVNALAGAASDPEPMVRIAAVRALGFVNSPRAPTLLAAHLKDDARVIRTAAAAGLFQLGIPRLDGPAGEALAAAQGEWMRSLRTFGDVADDDTVLGWLEVETGRAADGARDLETAVRLDPAAAQPQVYLGIVAAREGRYAEAVRRFKIAKSLYPSYANLDRLIEEAKKRVPPGGD